jgi:hypothetical protein
VSDERYYPSREFQVPIQPRARVEIRNYGCSGEQGLIGISASIENRIADPMELNYPVAEVIVNEDWDAIVCVARLLTERGILSRSELENEIFGSDIKMRVCLMRADEMFGRQFR